MKLHVAPASVLAHTPIWQPLVLLPHRRIGDNRLHLHIDVV